MEEEEREEIQEAIKLYLYSETAKTLACAMQNMNERRKKQNNILTIILAITFITKLIILVVTLLK